MFNPGPYYQKMKQEQRPRRGRRPKPPRQCKVCGTWNSTQWRQGPPGYHPLCNACGIRYRRCVEQNKPYDPTKKPQKRSKKSKTGATGSISKKQRQQPRVRGSGFDDTMGGVPGGVFGAPYPDQTQSFAIPKGRSINFGSSSQSPFPEPSFPQPIHPPPTSYSNTPYPQSYPQHPSSQQPYQQMPYAQPSFPAPGHPGGSIRPEHAPTNDGTSGRSSSSAPRYRLPPFRSLFKH